jgi:hypothetical protein
MPDGSTFPDAGAEVARQTKAELNTASPLYAAVRELSRMAEDIWCAAAERENRKARRYGLIASYSYSAEEMLAEELLEILGPPNGPLDEVVEKIAEALAERERRVA